MWSAMSGSRSCWGSDVDNAVRRLSGHRERFRTRLVLLGTAGGPLWWPRTDRAGVASAVVVGRRVYLVDLGEDALRQYRRAGLATSQADREAITDLRGVFFTHLHSDHIVDYNNLLQWSILNGRQVPGLPPVQVFGPGNRGSLPPLFGQPPAPPVVNPDSPTPGTVEMTEHLLMAYANDFNDRMRDNRLPDPRDQFQVHDISIPLGIVEDPNVDPAPLMDPFVVFENDDVRVSAVLVNHAPAFPNFAFRFDADDGSVVFSGDTAPHSNLVNLANDADILVHEVIDPDWVEGLFPDPSTPEAQAVIAHLVNAHTTIADVGNVAEVAGVKTLVLNHLLPANNSVSQWRKAKEGFSGHLVVGDDLLQLGVGKHSRGRNHQHDSQGGQ